MPFNSSSVNVYRVLCLYIVTFLRLAGKTEFVFLLFCSDWITCLYRLRIFRHYTPEHRSLLRKFVSLSLYNSAIFKTVLMSAFLANCLMTGASLFANKDTDTYVCVVFQHSLNVCAVYKHEAGPFPSGIPPADCLCRSISLKYTDSICPVT
jgi:hypothetical protein